MKRPLSLLVLALALSLLCGCWDNKELDEYGYVQAIAIDMIDEQQIQITTHFYNPASKMEMGNVGNPASKGINIVTTGETFFDAMREIPSKFGRKAKWDHMRVILLGEPLARSLNIREVLDFFSRDHEPRGTILPIITQHTAGHYLDIKPFIEQTIGQQIKRMEMSGSQFSAETSSIPLYDLAIQLSSPSKTSTIPYLHIDGKEPKAIISGVALIRDGKMVGVLKEPDTEAFMMLTDKYKYGVLEFPCMNNVNHRIQDKESLEVLSFNSRLSPTIHGDAVHVTADIAIEGTIGELRCSHLKSSKDVEQFEEAITKQVEEQIQHLLALLQKKKIDALGIGNQLFRKHPKLWRQLEPEWDSLIAETQFEVHVDVSVLSTGMNAGTLFGTKEK
ncbi:Ger(x)C family spore germination protein [Paenibacillus pinisoli]|uniref:Ger(X)C family spore germination protein n=1 Tax=Paenibacillus pinisoli TaxID=1276110 RepID=A0A3A6Q548_9BACL|nr:Ger(x)C family spore germination protein [Paenibacillus pinisoli]RJX40984.1 Ger(x)C family spore germination protein [Paenibacillus pinisoli]